jgi:acetyl esterase/lipase
MKLRVIVRSGLLAALLSLTASEASAQPRATDVSDRPSIILTADIPYATVDGEELALDLYMPAGVDDAPLIVWVHGGAWRFGSRKSVNAIDLVDSGFAIASIGFRLSPVAPFPAQVHDIKGAIRFLRAHAHEYGYDADRIAVSGASSGAHLAALVGVTNGHPELEGTVGGNLDQSSNVQAIVSYFGASNFTTILDQSTPFGLNVRVPALELLLGGAVEDQEALARLASPVFHIDSSDPPMYLLHGDQDPQMPINQTHELHGAAKEHGLDVTFDVVHGAAHGGAAFFAADRTKAVADFLNRYIGATH